MSRSRLHLNEGNPRARRRSLSTGLLALASFASLVAAGCGGERALNARDAAGLAGAGTAGRGGSGGPGGAGGTSGGGSVGGDGTGVAGTGADGSAGESGVAGAGGDGTGGVTVGTGGAGSGGTGVAGMGGRGGTGGSAGAGGTGGTRPTGPGATGTTCTSGADCMSSWCTDGFCCASECAGLCLTCAGAIKGACAPIPDITDPDSECGMDPPASCGKTGFCNGSGACRLYPNTQVCNAVATCDTANASVISMHVCNGNGTCVAAPAQSCNGFRCVAGACGTTCASDGSCVTGGFCSAATCVAPTPNLVGNGDLETGMTLGWSPANGGGTIGLSTVASSGVAHGGNHSIYATARSQYYHGPGYFLPTGAGKYLISAWALQKDLASITGALQIRVVCQTNTSYYLPVQPSGFGVLMPQGVWTQFSATVDTAAAGVDCLPVGAVPGLVRSAFLYLNHTEDTTAPLPDLYLDDLVVQVTDGHNLVGNPNFEAGSPDSWSLSAGFSTLAVDSTVAHLGMRSLHQASRSVPAAGPRWALPTGAARYALSFWVRHAGTQAHDLVLQQGYTCIGGTAVLPAAPIASATAVAPNTWTQLTGTAVYPPANATAGCKLALAAVHVQQGETGTCGTGASQIECPDLFIDDVSITIAP